MTNEERDIIQQFIARVSGAQALVATAPGSVPATIAPLPAVDREADALIGQLMVQYPEARYRLTQTAFVQEHALVAANNRMGQLEAELQQTRQALAQAQQAQQQQAQQQASGGGGFLGGLFGGGRSAPPPQQQAPVWNQGPQQGGQPPYGQPQYAPPPQQYPQGPQAGMFQRGGSGFLGSALTTAAGVAGGMVAGNALMNLFSGSHGAGSGFGGFPAAPAVDPAALNPWANSPLPEPPAPPDAAPIDQGSWDTGGASADNSGWQRQPDSGFDSGDQGGGFDTSDWGSGGGSDDV